MKVVNIEGVIGWHYTARDLRLALGAGTDDVLINVYSPGGSAFEGLEMYNIIKDYRGQVTVRLGAFAASAATILICAADKVVVRDTTIAMLHCAWVFAAGSSEELRDLADWLGDFDTLLATVYAKKTGKKKAEILKDMKSEKWLMGAQALINYGLADESTEDTSDLSNLEPEDINEEVASEVFNQVKNKMREMEITEEMKERVAAFTPGKRGIFAFLSPSQGLQQTEETDKDPVDNREENMEGRKMGLEELLAKNPEAKAEHDTLVASAKAEGESLVKKDRERVSELLNLSGVPVADELKTAIVDGTDVGAYAVAALKKVQGQPASDNASVISSTSTALQPADTAPLDRHSDMEARAKAIAAQMVKEERN